MIQANQMAEENKIDGQKNEEVKGPESLTLDEKIRQVNAASRGGDFNPNLPKTEEQSKLKAIALKPDHFLMGQIEAELGSMRKRELDKVSRPAAMAKSFVLEPQKKHIVLQ